MPGHLAQPAASCKFRGMRTLSRLVALLMPLVTGCTLPDQRTFLPAPVAPGPGEATRAKLPTRPLVTIRMPLSDPAWAQQAAEALTVARARRPTGEFDIVAAVKLGDPAGEAARQAIADTREVAEALSRQGIGPELLHLGLQPETAVVGREVRIFVR